MIDILIILNHFVSYPSRFSLFAIYCIPLILSISYVGNIVLMVPSHTNLL